MDFEQLQKTWQEQTIPASITIKEDTLLQITRRNQQEFLSTILRRDIIEVAVCILFAIFFVYQSLETKSISELIIAMCCSFVGSFFIIDRIIQRKRKPRYKDNLRCCLTLSLSQINHQIWLLRNVLWWYLLPISIGIFVGPIWETGLGGLNMGHIFAAVLFYGVYRINQHAVLYGLIPRRNEIMTLLNQFDPRQSDQADVEPAPTYTKTNQVIDGLIIIVLYTLFLVGIYFIANYFIALWTNRQDVNINDFANQNQYVNTLLSDQNRDNELIIIEARYGCEHHWYDVTEIVKKAVKPNGLVIYANNDLAGDPCLGKQKSLVVHYVYKGKQQTLQVLEGEQLVLPSQFE